jgi:hypothetical protein
VHGPFLPELSKDAGKKGQQQPSLPQAGIHGTGFF